MTEQERLAAALIKAQIVGQYMPASVI